MNAGPQSLKEVNCEGQPRTRSMPAAPNQWELGFNLPPHRLRQPSSISHLLVYYNQGLFYIFLSTTTEVYYTSPCLLQLSSITHLVYYNQVLLYILLSTTTEFYYTSPCLLQLNSIIYLLVYYISPWLEGPSQMSD